MKLLSRIGLHLLGFALLTLGAALIIKSGQGAMVFDGLALNLRDLVNHSKFTMAVSCITIGVIWMIINFIIIRKAYTLYSIVITLTLGFFIGFWLDFVLKDFQLTETFLNVILAIVSLVIMGFGISLLVFNKSLPMGCVEISMIYITKFTKKLFISKLIIDFTLFCIMLSISVILNDYKQIGWFTLVSVFALGPIISFFVGKLKRFISVY